MEIGPHVVVFFCVGALAFAGWLLHPTVRRALGDGGRCVARFPSLWRIPAGFALIYGVFQWVAEALLLWRVGEWSVNWMTNGHWVHSHRISDQWHQAVFHAVERTTALANDVIIPFPLSAGLVVWAILFRRNVIAQLIRTTKRGFPRAWLFLVVCLMCSAMAAVIKPAIYLFLPEWIEWFADYGNYALLGATTINMIALIFEIFIGSYVTVFLMLMAFSWIRGINADRLRLHILTARRMRFVLKWTILTTGLAIGLVALPISLGFGDIGHFVYVGILLALFPVQAVLVFHNGSLRSALRSSVRLIKQNGAAVILFVLGAVVFFFLLALLSNEILIRCQGESPGILIQAAFGTIGAALSGWLVASWVCLYRRIETDKHPAAF